MNGKPLNCVLLLSSVALFSLSEATMINSGQRLSSFQEAYDIEDTIRVYSRN